MVGAVIEQAGTPPIAVDSVREYLGVGDAVSADLLTELVGAASDLIQGPGSLTNTCFTPHILAAAQDEALPGALRDWRLRLPGGPSRGDPQVTKAAYGTSDGAVEVVPTTQDFYRGVDAWHWRVPKVIQDAVDALEKGVQKVRFSGEFARLEGYVAVRYTSGDGTVPREVSVAIKQQVQSLWDHRSGLVPGHVKPNPALGQLLRKWNANGLVP